MQLPTLITLLSLLAISTSALPTASPSPAPAPSNFDAILSNDDPNAGAYSSPRIVVGFEKREWGLWRRRDEIMGAVKGA
ncbi:hypothetical protein EJ08DRAFT_651820 [Tothia fuscella]|uniref:Uncharacterized protein n=1 Tax=Tothia fuscella TaxID=1048955 RepID=A0A9P4NLB2_9PEZI|nr:hypothetical protein EJ08DRAFT_651820 [Tothia fuscella]